MSNLKKLFFVFMVASTVLMNLVGIVTPAEAVTTYTAAQIANGDIIGRVGLAGKYIVTVSNGVMTKDPITSGYVYKSWLSNDYSETKWMTATEFNKIGLGSGLLKARPGSLIAFYDGNTQVDSKIYAIDANYNRHEVTDTVGASLYGANWKTKSDTAGGILRVRSLETMFYPLGAALTTYPEGTLVNVSGSYYVVGANGTKRMVTAAGLTANKFKTERAVSATSLSGTEGAQVTTGEYWTISANTTTPTTPVSTGALSVALSGNNPTGANIPSGSLYNSMLAVNLTASNSGSVTVTGLTVTRGGYFANTNISGVSAWVDGYRKGNIVESLTSDGKAVLSFGNSPLVIAAGTTKTVWVKANLAASVTGSLSFSINAATDIAATGVTPSGSFPLVGNTMNVVSGSDSLAAFTLGYNTVAGATWSTISSAAGNVDIGSTQKIVGKYTVQETSSREDVKLQQLVVYLQGTVVESTDLSNWTLYGPEGTVVATANASYDRYVTFNLNNGGYLIPKGQQKEFTVKVDVIGGSTRNFRTQIQNSYDILVQGVTTGAYIAPTSFSAVADPAGGFVMKSGSLTITRADTSPSGNVSPAATNVVLGRFDLKSGGEQLEVRQLDLYIASTTASILTGTVFVQSDDGSETYYSTAATTGSLYLSDSATRYTLSSYISIPAGQTKRVKVVADINSAATTGSVTVTLRNFYTKRFSTNDYQDLAATGADSNALSVSASALSVNKNTTMGSDTAAPSDTNRRIGSFTFAANNSSDITVTGITLGFASGTMDVANQLSNVTLKDEASGTVLGTFTGTLATSSNSISVNWVIPKNTTKVLNVYGNIGSGATSGETIAVQILTGNISGSTSYNSLSSTPSSNVFGQTIQIAAASLAISKESSSDTNSKILAAGLTMVPLEVLNFRAYNRDVTLNKLTFTVSSSNSASSSNFKKVYLFNGSTNLTPGGINFSAADAVVTGLNLVLPANQSTYLTVKADVNDSGYLTSGSVSRIQLKSTTTTDFEAYAGSQLSAANIAGTPGVPSNYFLFHDAYPVLSAAATQPSFATGATVDAGTVTISNPGQVTMRLTQVKFNLAASGLAGASGNIGNFKLYEGGTYLAATSTGEARLTSSTLTTTATFDASNDQNSAFDNLTIAPGSSRTFTIKADTTMALDGKTTGTVTLTVSIDGASGYDGTSGTTTEDEWNEGLTLFKYTPNGSSTESSSWSAQDNMPLSVNSMYRSL